MSDQQQATIMVVDDTPANLKLLQDMLQAKGYRVLALPNGKMALTAAAKRVPDLILLDINMPEMNGLEVCERLKSDETLKEIPVLFISGRRETTDKVKAFSVGGLDYITKPFECEEVLARVNTHVRLRCSQIELARKNQELDISYRKLKELEAWRQALTHMIVHDLRSPLSGIIGYLDILQAEIAEDLSEEHRDFLCQARVAAAELARRINTVLDVNRLEEGAMPLHLAPVDMVEIVQTAMASLGGQVLKRQIVLNSPGAPIQVLCDRDLIERVVGNLLHNAVKFSPEHSTIRVMVEPRASAVRVAVQDEGPGVPPEYRSAVFEKFRQLEVPKARHKTGTGLGLAFCKLAVEAHNGAIGLDCPTSGGSRFWFEIPLGQAGPQICTARNAAI